MTRQEFVKRMEIEKPLERSEITIEVGELIDSPYVLGCYQDNGIWKIYRTKERGGYYIIDEYGSEDTAFNELYELVYIEKNNGDLISGYHEPD